MGLSMIKKLVFLFLLFPMIAFAGADTIGGVAVEDIDTIGGVPIEDIDTIGGVTVDLCTLYYSTGDKSLADTARPIGNTVTVDFYGSLYTPAADICVCKVDFVYYSVNGTASSIDSYNYHVRIFEDDGSNGDDVSLGVPYISDAVSGANVRAVGTGEFIGFSFTTGVQLTGSQLYGITLFIDTDSNLTDDPGDEIDATNYWNFGDDNEGPASQGRVTYTYDASIPYARNSPDLDDDPVIRVYSSGTTCP